MCVRFLSHGRLVVFTIGYEAEPATSPKRPYRPQWTHVMSLEDEVDTHRKSIRTDGYPMSVGELSTMYRDGELELHPEFQRFFRWSPRQKSKLIESLLLGIPIPSVFVHQRDDGVWDVVDGLQRLSAIFEVMGILKGDDGNVLPPMGLEGTKYLPSLSGKTWGANEADVNGIGGTLQRVLKRAKLDVKIVLRESDADTKLELFQRLNTGGTPLSGQELRNCQIIMVNSSTLDRIRELAEEESFKNSVALSDRNIEEQYDLELVIRFVTLRQRDPNATLGDLGPFLDDAMIAIARDQGFNWQKEMEVFKATFSAIADSCEDNAFRRYNPGRDRFTGGFSVSAFEVLALGLGYLFESAAYTPPNLVEKAKSLWRDHNLVQDMRGRRSGERLRSTLTFGRTFLAP